MKDLESEKQSLELVLDRTMNLYRQTFSERNQMIDTWRAAVRSLNIRDRTINESIEVNQYQNRKFSTCVKIIYSILLANIGSTRTSQNQKGRAHGAN